MQVFQNRTFNKFLIFSMHTIKLAVFDMAGTVVNEDNVVYKTLQKAINERGFQLTLDFLYASVAYYYWYSHPRATARVCCSTGY
mgnify:CR=1 FL=1